MTKSSLILCCFCGTVATMLTFAQDLAPAPMPANRVLPDVAPPPRPMPMIFIPNKTAKDRAITISKASVHSRIMGDVCETTVTMTIHNPNGRVMEGEFTFPLPPESTIQGYALDIAGKLVDAVPVTKEKARVVLEEESRRNVDPGLVESVGGNNFKTRVYPIPAYGDRVVRLRYISTLPAGGDKGKTIYRIPLNFQSKLEVFDIQLDIVTSTAPQIASSPISNLTFDKQETLFVAKKSLQDIALTEDIVVELPAAAPLLALVEKFDGKFYALLPVPATMQSACVKPVQSPKKVTIVWDASGSMAKADTQAALHALCKTLFEAKDYAMDLIIMRDTATAPLAISSAQELTTALAKLPYDGATGDFQGTVAGIIQAGDAEDMIIMVTDGLVNYAADQAPLPPRGKLFALVPSSQSNYSSIKRMGATPLTLEDMCTYDMAHLNALHVGTESCNSILIDGQPWASALASPPVIQVRGTEQAQLYFFVSGIIPEGKHTISVTTKNPGKPVVFEVDTATATAGTLARGSYAQARLNELELERPSTDRTKRMQALGEEYGIVTPGTSLLVLESLDQYQRHQVRPPASTPVERQQYDAYIASNAERIKKQELARLQIQAKQTQTTWKANATWFEQDFSKAKPNTRTETRKAAGGAMVSNMEVDTFAVPDEQMSLGSSAPVHAPRAPRPSVSPAEAVQEENREGEMTSYCMERPGAVATGMTIPARAKSDLSGGSGVPAPPSIEVQAWDAKATYVAELAKATDSVAEYYKQRATHGKAPAFYLDCADFFHKAKNAAMARQVISNLVELELEDRSLMRVLGYKLRFMGELQHAKFVLQRVLEVFPEEPQSYRDLALVLAELGEDQAALDLYAQMLAKPMHDRFTGIEQIALVEMNRLICQAQAKGKPLSTEGIPKELLTPVQADIRVVLNWDTDNSDMDLWMTDKAGEKCFYSHNRTATGGMISRDVTDGYGPEEFRIKTARPGSYLVQADYYGTRSQKMLAPVTLYAEIFTNYARPNEEKQTLIFRLAEAKETVKVGKVTFTPISYDGEIKGGRTYQIKANDTLASIAKEELDDEKYVDVILRLNPELKPDQPLKKGTFIKLP